MRPVIILFFCFSVACCALSCASADKNNSSGIRQNDAAEYRDYDVVLEGQPVLVRKVEAGSRFDAVADEETELAAVVVLKISRITKGKLPELRINPSARANRFNYAVKKEKTFGAVLGSMMPQRTKIIQRSRFSVAVRDPAESFGVADWENPVPAQYRLYLNRFKDQHNTYVMVKKEKIETPDGAGE